MAKPTKTKVKLEVALNSLSHVKLKHSQVNVEVLRLGVNVPAFPLVQLWTQKSDDDKSVKYFICVLSKR